MKLVSKFFLAVLLLTVASVSWAACPDGGSPNYKGECLGTKLPPLGLNAEEAIKHYFRGRNLDPIEGIWREIGGEFDYEIAIVRNDFDVHPGFQYVGILTDSRNEKWQRGQVKIVIKSIVSLDQNFVVKWFMSNHSPWHFSFRMSEPNVLYGISNWTTPTTLRRVFPEDGYARNQESGIPSEGLTPGLAGTGTPAEWKLIGTGTGFIVNKEYVLTAAHVLKECDETSIRYRHKEMDTEIVAMDSNNDLGLLLLEKHLEQTAKFRGSKPIRLGDTVVNYGYPLFGQLSDHAKVTKGEINSLAGWNNDSREIQYDAATQPGNSGGPVLDLSGNIVGVVTSGLSGEYAEQTGHIAQNVNFAVKSFVAEAFLSANGVDYERAESVEKLETADIAEKAERFTVLIGCWEGSRPSKSESVAASESAEKEKEKEREKEKEQEEATPEQTEPDEPVTIEKSEGDTCPEGQIQTYKGCENSATVATDRATRAAEAKARALAIAEAASAAAAQKGKKSGTGGGTGTGGKKRSACDVAKANEKAARAWKERLEKDCWELNLHSVCDPIGAARVAWDKAYGAYMKACW